MNLKLNDFFKHDLKPASILYIHTRNVFIIYYLRNIYFLINTSRETDTNVYKRF